MRSSLQFLTLGYKLWRRLGKSHFADTKGGKKKEEKKKSEGLFLSTVFVFSFQRSRRDGNIKND